MVQGLIGTEYNAAFICVDEGGVWGEGVNFCLFEVTFTDMLGAGIATGVS